VNLEFSFVDDDSSSACYCGAAITFVTGGGFTLEQVDLKLADGTGTPDVTVNIDLYAVDGSHKPTGASLYSIGSIDQDTLTGTTTWHSFSGLSYVLSGTTEYAIVCDVNTKDGTSNFRWAQGNASYTDGVDWIPQGCQDWSGHTGTWNFRVYSADATPSKPTNPDPADDATDVDFSDLTLDWDDGGGADTFDTYVGDAADNLTKIGNALEATFYVLDASERALFTSHCYWRIDATNDQGTTTGDVWDFVVAGPGKAKNPIPSDNQEGVYIRGIDRLREFSWEAPD
jgi:hypothetical protein